MGGRGRLMVALALLLSGASLAHGFGLASLTMVRTGPQPKRVAIVGAGPAGLSLAIALRRLDTGVETVRIFELLVVNNNVMVYAIMRDNLQSVLSNNVDQRDLTLGKKVVKRGGVRRGGGARPATLEFADGTREEFDLVIGADGINSKVRKAIVGPESPSYIGIKILFGVAPRGKEAEGDEGPTRPSGSDAEFHQWFGTGGYGLASTYGGLGGTKVDQIALCIADDRPASSNPEWK
ncbi:hypothetical protein T484DRAFT_1770569, partial [Baffinella frigidus]